MGYARGMILSMEDLRGSAPTLSAKDVLLELRADVKDMKATVDVVASQQLNERLTEVERFQWRVTGLAGAGTIIGVIALTVTIMDTILR